MLSTPAFADGQCIYYQFSPHLRTWFSTCEAPISESACNVRSSNQHKAAPAFGKGSCSLEKVVGACEIEGRTLYFYEGTPSDLERGCERMGGKVKPILKE